MWHPFLFSDVMGQSSLRWRFNGYQLCRVWGVPNPRLWEGPCCARCTWLGWCQRESFCGFPVWSQKSLQVLEGDQMRGLQGETGYFRKRGWCCSKWLLSPKRVLSHSISRLAGPAAQLTLLSWEERWDEGVLCSWPLICCYWVWSLSCKPWVKFQCKCICTCFSSWISLFCLLFSLS